MTAVATRVGSFVANCHKTEVRDGRQVQCSEHFTDPAVFERHMRDVHGKRKMSVPPARIPAWKPPRAPKDTTKLAAVLAAAAANGDVVDVAVPDAEVMVADLRPGDTFALLEGGATYLLLELELGPAGRGYHLQQLPTALRRRNAYPAKEGWLRELTLRGLPLERARIVKRGA